MNRGRISVKQYILKRNISYCTKFNTKIQSNSAKGIKNIELQLCRQHFIVEALLVIEPPNIVPPNENAVCTATILDFFSVNGDLTTAL